MRARVLGAWIMLVAAAGSAGFGDDVILGKGTYWRAYDVAKTPVVREKAGEALREEPRAAHAGSTDFWRVEGPPPPNGWQEPAFNDRTWGRVQVFGSRSGCTSDRLVNVLIGYPPTGLLVSPTLALQCVRGKFHVPAAGEARGLRLAVLYRGGVVVYLNGTEVARGHLPDGKIDAATLAEAYPPEAFILDPRKRTSEGEGEVQLDLRVRTLEAALPAALIQSGTNVLALEVHRAPYFGTALTRADYNFHAAWATGGLIEATLTAEAGVEPNTARPAGIQVWNCPADEWVDASSYGDPVESLGPIELVGVRNGVFEGQVVVSSSEPLRGVRGEVGTLRLKGSHAVIPADRVTVSYVTPADWLNRDRDRRRQIDLWDMILPEPPAEVGTVLPIRVAVRVPADAPPGAYEGTLRVRADGLEPTTVPICTKVIDWTLPDPGDFVTHLGFIQSPDSVAMWYQAPLWSERHWRLMESSFRLLGELGNKALYLPLIARTNLGNEESLVRWVRKPGVKNGGDGAIVRADDCTLDFSMLDRYLDLAQKYLKPEIVVLYAFDHESIKAHSRGPREPRWAGVPITATDPATGQADLALAPKFDVPEAKAFWAPVFLALRDRLQQRGLLKAAMIGTISDWSQPSKEVRALFGEWLPDAPWVTQTHPGSFNIRTPGYFTQVYIRSYLTPYPWRTGEPVAWRRDNKQGWFLRGFNIAAPLAVKRTHLERSFLHNCSGWGRVGADFWPLGIPTTRPGTVGMYYKGTTTIAARYPETDWGQLNLERGGPLALLAPGPEGAIPTVRFEAVRQGLQECEARIFIEQALIDPAFRAKLGDDLAGRCDALLEERVNTLKSGGGDLTVLAERLFGCAADVAARIGRN